MPERRAPGLAADWLNGWLAAIGTTVLVPGLRLTWTRSAPEVAVFTSDGDSIPAQIAHALPSLRELQQLAIAKEHPDTPRFFEREPSLQDFKVRAAIARQRHDPSLGVTMTDLVVEEEAPQHSPFDPPVPQGQTIHDRLVRCRSLMRDVGDNLAEIVSSTLDGLGRRVTANGLGFDYRRLPAAEVKAPKTVDPVVEVLAFHGLCFFPARGNGHRATVRGWTAAPSTRGAFTWPVWEPELDRWAIDALLDRWYRFGRSAARFGVYGAYRSIPFRSRGSSDVTRAYAAERSW